MDEIVLFDQSRKEAPIVAFQGVQLAHARGRGSEASQSFECAVFISASARIIVAFRSLPTDETLVGFEDYPAEWTTVQECGNRYEAEIWGAFGSPHPPLFWRAWREAWRRWPVQ